MPQLPDMRGADDIRRDIEGEREQLASAVEALRAGISDATNVAGKLRARLPVAAAGAFGVGFVLWGGIGATMRLLARRSRSGDTAAKIGRFSIVDRG